MATETAPAYQWYVKDWRSSRATMRMTFAERGVYREMLDEQWEAGFLPDNPEAVAELISTTDAQHAEVLAAWAVVRRKFATVDGHDDRILNLRLEAYRRSKKKFKKTATEGGKARAAGAVRDARGAFSGVQPTTSKLPAGTPADSQQGDQPPSSNAPAGAPAGEPAESSSATASSTATATASATASADPLERAMDAWRAHWKRAYGHESSLLLKPLELMQLDQQITAVGEARFLEAMAAYFATEDAYVRNAKHPLPLFLRDPLKHLARAAKAAPARPRGCKHEPACKDDAAHTTRDLAERRAS